MQAAYGSRMMFLYKSRIKKASKGSRKYHQIHSKTRERHDSVLKREKINTEGHILMKINDLYNIWCEKVTDQALQAELKAMAGDEAKIDDCFYQSLAFGTGGLRGILGAGTNRMNIHTVGVAAQAVAQWVNDGGNADKGVAIAYDSRNMSTEMARISAAILAANGVKAYIYTELQPTPLASYAVMKLGCAAGIVITASHNPAKYNGFKCYGPEGYQLTDDDAHAIEHIMSGLDIFDDVKVGDYDKLLADGLIVEMGDDVVDGFIDAIMKCQIHPEACREAGLKVIYTPLCGAGHRPVCKALERAGIEGLRVVESQRMPDGNFPGLVRPNPEERAAFDEALKMTADYQADLLLATDPDCDRVGIAVRDGDGYTLLNGNETGVLLMDYMLGQLKAVGKLHEKPVAIRSIVSSALADKVCENYGCHIRCVLTGFKYIGEVMAKLAANGESDRFVLGFEESYGYLCGDHARDKDAVVASLMICEMVSYYKQQGKPLLEVLYDLYNKYGWYRHRLINLDFEPGQAGEKMRDDIMDWLRNAEIKEISGSEVVEFRDYTQPTRSAGHLLPTSNVLEYVLSDDSVLIARPSGTEPKLKFYLTAQGDSMEASDARLDELAKAVYTYAKESVGYES